LTLKNMKKAGFDDGWTQSISLGGPVSDFSNNRSRSSRRKELVNRAEWIALFEVLAAIAFIEASPSQHKIETLVDTVLELKASLDPMSAITKKSFLFWVGLNRKRLSKSRGLEASYIDFMTNLEALNSISHKSDIILAMARVAIADNTYADEARLLISQTILHWDMPAQTFMDLKYICPEILWDASEDLKSLIVTPCSPQT